MIANHNYSRSLSLLNCITCNFSRDCAEWESKSKQRENCIIHGNCILLIYERAKSCEIWNFSRYFLMTNFWPLTKKTPLYFDSLPISHDDYFFFQQVRKSSKNKRLAICYLKKCFSDSFPSVIARVPRRKHLIRRTHLSQPSLYSSTAEICHHGKFVKVWSLMRTGWCQLPELVNFVTDTIYNHFHLFRKSILWWMWPSMYPSNSH